HVDGKRQVYIPIYRQPGANTIQAVEGVKAAIPRIAARRRSTIVRMVGARRLQRLVVF
ncbi:MAG: efflux RND transporter permease subunit, partial [Acidobacteria bacterium]|nr:efflux RND transporter permease subunit [Acidobacteriota bacterium]